MSELTPLIPVLRASETHLSSQIARSMFCDDDRSSQISRSLRELRLSAQISVRFSRPQREAVYLNRVYLGEGMYGVEAAAQRYFGKHASSLSPAEAALLVSLAWSPSILSPYRHPDRALRRRNKLLSVMHEQGSLSDAAFAAAQAAPLGVK